MTAPQSIHEPRSAPRVPTLGRAASSALARAELDRFDAALSLLTEADGRTPTACPGWDVRAMASHVLGMTRMFSSYAQNARQHLPAAKAAKHGAVYIDALTARQVADRRQLDLTRIRSELVAVAPRNVRWRRRAPALLRNRTMPGEQPVNGSPDAQEEPWTFGYLFDTILTRDTWMHRTDIALATGQPLELSADHDGVIVDNVVTEWASRHSEPYELHLTGTAGGHWSRGSGGPVIELDAVHYCRVLSGRGEGHGLMSVGVPF